VSTSANTPLEIEGHDQESEACLAKYGMSQFLQNSNVPIKINSIKSLN